MNPFHPLSAVEQLAAHLREEILRGGLGQSMPGVSRTAKSLGVSPKTVIAAMKQLEREGMLQGQGQRRRSRVMMPENFTPAALRLVILPYEKTDRTQHALLDIQHKLQRAGHSVGFASKTLLDLGLDAKRVARFVKESPADAWVIIGGSREVLEWFGNQPVPAFALFGRRRGVKIAGAGPDKIPPLVKAVNRLVELGHRRIVMLLREEQRKPNPGLFGRTFFETMASHGLPTSPYNLPDWEDNAESFRHCIDSLLRVTPPSAFIIDESFLFDLAQQHLARRGILAPEHVSLVCTDPDPAFDWYYPSVAHISWDSRQVTRCIVRWADNLARGKEDCSQIQTKAEFIEGGTIGPAHAREQAGR